MRISLNAKKKTFHVAGGQIAIYRPPHVISDLEHTQIVVVLDHERHEIGPLGISRLVVSYVTLTHSDSDRLGTAPLSWFEKL